MQQHFYETFDRLTSGLAAREVLLGAFSGEQSDFVRFNHARFRQPGSVRQAYLTLELIDGSRHLRGTCTLTGAAATDDARAAALLKQLRADLPSLPEDPYLAYAAEVRSSEHVRPNELPPAAEIAEAALAAGAGLDMVGLLAAGGVFAGFASSLGQKNWFATHSFLLDWCFYHAADKAVKTTLGGFAWDAAEFARRSGDARRQLILAQPAKTIRPGGYRVYLAPAAVSEIMTMLCYGGFSLKAHRTKTTSLLKMVEGGAALSPAVTLRENTAGGIAPNFQAQGFIRPPSVTLIEAGRYKDCLVSPRSAKEFRVATNGAESWEHPHSLDMAAGDLPAAEAAERLGTGVYVNRLWYLNYSDRPACRMTGMTRFGTFWVEGGRIAAPLNVMRFDETIYRMLGQNLLGLTAERDFLPATDTYDARSTDSMHLPGALIDDFRFTL